MNFLEIGPIVSMVATVIIAGVQWGSLNTRLKAVEKTCEESAGNRDRLIRLETKVDLILRNLNKTYSHV